MREPADVHERDPECFAEEVHSFAHWFESVSGYLSGLENGHLADLPEADFTRQERENLINALCTYCVGEAAALEASSGLVRIAPNAQTRIFLATQVADEARHTEVLLRRLRELGLESPEREYEARAAPALLDFKEKLLRLVDAGQWDASLFAQNVMLESMEYAVFHAHARTADPRTRDLLERILRDERRHLGFGENEVARRLRGKPERRAWVRVVKEELDRLVLDTIEHAARDLGASAKDAEALGRDYLHGVERLGLGDDVVGADE